MRGIIFASLVVAALAVGLVMVDQSSAEAASPATATITPTVSITLTDTATATPTPTSAMEVSVDVTVNAAPSFDPVTALIGDVECASATPVWPPDSGGTSAILSVPAAAERPGCGAPGAIVHFRIGGRPARETVVWEPGGFAHVSLIVGPDWSSFYGRYVWHRTPGDPLFSVVTVIDGRDCGVQGNPLLGEGPEWGYDVRVLPDELRPGCGKPGAVVHFELRAGDVLLANAQETAIWEPLALQELNLTFSPVRVLPATGSGPPAASRERVAFALAAAGIACGAAGARVRRRSAGVASRGRRAAASRSS